MRVAVLSSGGKDSAAAIWWTMCKGWDIVAIVTVHVQGDDSHMFQLPGTHLVGMQAEVMKIPWVEVNTLGDGTQHDDIHNLSLALSRLDIDGFVTGALRSDFQKTRLERMAHQLNIKSWTPLWHQKGADHLKGMIEHGFQILLTSVSTDGLGPEWLGKILRIEDYHTLLTLSQTFRFNIDGEGGEYETYVLAGPHMPHEVKVNFHRIWEERRGHLEFIE